MKKTLTIVSYQNPNNTYINELIKNLSLYYIVFWGNDFFWDNNFRSDYYIIHWPENIKVRDDKFSFSISNLKDRIKFLKSKGSIISAFFHDKTPHFSNSSFFTNLFEVVYTNVDIIFHLGNYSVNILKDMFPKCITSTHIVIKHALFETVPNTITKKVARDKFGFKKDDFVISFLGNLRSQEEVILIYKIFKNLNIKNKKLLIGSGEVIDYSSFINKQLSRLRKIYYVGHNLKSNFGKFVPDDEIQYYYNASDVILVPRIQNLNSGVAVMAMTFNIPFVSPAVGNITELALETGNFTFKLGDINQAVKIIDNIYKNPNIKLSISDDYLGKNVAKKIFDSLDNYK